MRSHHREDCEKVKDTSSMALANVRTILNSIDRHYVARRSKKDNGTFPRNKGSRNTDAISLVGTKDNCIGDQGGREFPLSTIRAH